MTTRDELEAALRAHPDDATLAVYADLLQAQNDPRGELIALDLRAPAMSTRGIETRRGQLLEAWLGDDIDLQFDAEQGIWYAGSLGGTCATFDCGFVELSVDGDDDVLVARLLAGRAGEYVRRLSIRGPTALAEPVLEGVAARRRPWLQHLAIARPAHETPLLVGLELRDKLVAATPNLEVLDLEGRNLLARFTHPNLRELGVTGSEAIDLADGPPLPALRTIDFALDGDRPVPRGVFDPERVPVLRRLDVAREETSGVRLFELLGTLAVAGQLTHLVVPALTAPRHVALLQAAIDRMPMLRDLAIARGYECFGTLGSELRHAWARVRLPTPWPWPPPSRVRAPTLVVDGHALQLHLLIAALEERYDELPEEIRAIWYRFWTTLDTLEDPRPYYGHSREQAFSAADLVDGLLALPGDSHLDAVRDHLRARIERRGPFLAMMHWG